MFEFRNKVEGEALIQARMIRRDPSLACNRAHHFRPGQDTGTYGAARKGLTDLRRFWNKNIWPDAPEDFKQRLRRIRTLPTSLDEMRPGRPGDFTLQSTFDLIQWDKLMLAGGPCKDYTVRAGRMFGMKPVVLQPDWEEITAMVEGTQRLEQLWRGAWRLLNWKYRPPGHYDAYWRVLHKRPQRANNIGVSNVKDYTVGKCYNCGDRDIGAHSFVLCPAVREIWTNSLGILRRLIKDVIGISVEFTVPEVVLGFPEVRRALPKEVRMRVVLWHSAIIYTITLRREMCLREQTHDDGTLFDFSGWEAVAVKQIKTILIEIGQRLWTVRFGGEEI